jgi:hypothetical protein
MKLRLRIATAVAAAIAVGGGVLTAGSAQAALQPAVGGYQFGAHYLAPGSTTWPTMPYGTLRIWDDGFTWRDLQPSAPGASGDGFDAARLGRLDTLISAAHAKGKQVVMVLGESPDWAVPVQCNYTGQATSAFYSPQASCAPRYPDGSVNGALWQAYVKRLLTLPHGTYINAFEVWNEANFPTYFNDSPAAAAALTYLTRKTVASLGRKTAVLTPSVGARHPNAPGWLRSFFSGAKAYGMPFDAVAVHLYPTGTNGPETMVAPLRAVKSAMSAYGVGGRRIFDTEVGAGYRAGNQVMRGDEIPGRVVRTFLMELTNGVNRTVWYGWNDTGFGGDPINSGNSLTAAGLGFKTVYAWLVGNRPYGPCHQMAPSGAWRYGWTCDIAMRDGTHARVLWNVAPSKARLYYTAPRGVTRIYGSTGKSKAIAGGYRFGLGVAPVLIKGAF